MEFSPMNEARMQPIPICN